jgi:hypothetical protein
VNNQEILDNAPDGAEFTSSMGYLWNENDDWFIYEPKPDEWVHLFFHEYTISDWEIRSLADIRRIKELEKYAGNLSAEKIVSEILAEKRIAELEKDKETLTQHHDMWEGQWHELHGSLPIRDLEQQAKECDWIYSNVPDLSNGNYIKIKNRASWLLNQAEALKGQGK